MMKTLLFTIALAVFALTGAQGAVAKDDLATQSVKLVDSRPREAALIYNWLKNTPEIRIHQLRGATENKVYILPGGHKEAVYDGAGKLVQDGMNDGSYNYYPYDQPLNHFAYDTFPWLLWGASKKDPSTQKERIAAYVYDLSMGVTKLGKAQDKTVDLSKLAPHETVVLAMFMTAIEQSGGNRVYTYLADPKLPVSASEGPLIVEQLEKSIAIILKDSRKLAAIIPRLPREK